MLSKLDQIYHFNPQIMMQLFIKWNGWKNAQRRDKYQRDRRKRKRKDVLADEAEQVEVCNWQLVKKIPQLYQTLREEERRKDGVEEGRKDRR